MITNTLHRLHHDTGWTGLAATLLAVLGAALTTLAYTAWSRTK